VDIAALDRDRLDDLRELYAGLHGHHAGIGTPGLVADRELSWTRRRANYDGWLADGTGFALVALHEGQPVGYAFVRLHAGEDDTFRLGAGHGELYSLAVHPAWRNHGIGSGLLDAVDAALAARGIRALAVSVMTANEDAIRLYRNRGLEPAELILFRFDRGDGA
jgi:ribosomal protein S18 acetylase RimI-like enzyme